MSSTPVEATNITLPNDIKEALQPMIETLPQLHLRGEDENDQINKEVDNAIKIRDDELSKELKLELATRTLL